MKRIVFVLMFCAGASELFAGGDSPAWTKAHLGKPPTAAEAKSFMKELTLFVRDNHLRTDASSAQRGMVYEYLDWPKRGQSDQFVQGEALDTMHDGAWLAAALVSAARAHDDPVYRDFLTRWQLPFYCKMLNHSDTLFSARRSDARPGVKPFNREHALQEGEKGFVPYFWDDGGSVSLERRRDKNPLSPIPCVDHLAGKPNPQFRLDGYSLGSSNHMAQDLGVMLQQAWLLLRESTDDAGRGLARDVAEAARNLHECRMRHHGHIPMCDAPAALAGGDGALMKFVPAMDNKKNLDPDNHYWKALYAFKPGQRYSFPGFADDQEYRYYAALAKHGGKLPRAFAFRTIYEAYTEPLLYRAYSDDAPVPAGINRFDLHPYYCKDGRPEDFRSDRKGPGGRPRPIGSRMGPQNMVCCGWALMALRAHPGIWEERYQTQFGGDLRVYIVDRPPGCEEVAVPTPKLVDFGPLKLSLSGERDRLVIAGTCAAAEARMQFFAGPDGQGAHAVVSMNKDRLVKASNETGAELLVRGEVTPGAKGFSFRVALPYSFVKGQKPWANGVEHGRYSLRVGGQSRNYYLASPEALVRRALEHELGGGLQTWKAIFREKGYIPTGLGAGADWDRFSDSGGYAHLIGASAMWALYLDGKNDWDVHRYPGMPPRAR